MIAVLSWILVVMPVVNAIFVVDATRRWMRIGGPILFALAIIKVVIWGMGVFVGVVALRNLIGLPSLPAGGIGLAVVLLAVNALPFYVWLTMRGVEGSDGDE